MEKSEGLGASTSTQIANKVRTMVLNSQSFFYV